ncbi:MAG: phosphate transport system regulatory protein PhoU [Deltaproteobacteria bacterium]|nr:MAG: phosphate transport system regulatory protein PhoU [Deltaproteobacteria bacterium]
MSRHLQGEIEKLKKHILALSALVEESLHKAIKSLLERDEKLARQVIKGDKDVDQMEVDVEEECLKILALHQPVAIDLRFIVAILKINNDLERIGDLAVNIAKRAMFSSTKEPIGIEFDFPRMMMIARSMLKRSIDALVNMDTATATEVCASDDEIDSLNREMYRQIQGAIRKYPERMECLIHLFAVSRHLERIADHATNIAEDVIYMVEGEIIRHRGSPGTDNEAR